MENRAATTLGGREVGEGCSPEGWLGRLRSYLGFSIVYSVGDTEQWKGSWCGSSSVRWGVDQASESAWNEFEVEVTREGRGG